MARLKGRARKRAAAQKARRLDVRLARTGLGLLRQCLVPTGRTEAYTSIGPDGQPRTIVLEYVNPFPWVTGV